MRRARSRRSHGKIGDCEQSMTKRLLPRYLMVKWCPQTDNPFHCLLFSSLLKKYRWLSTGYHHHYSELTGRNVTIKYLIIRQSEVKSWKNVRLVVSLCHFVASLCRLVAPVSDKCKRNRVRYPVDSDLSGGKRYPPFEQLGPGLFLIFKIKFQFSLPPK